MPTLTRDEIRQRIDHLEALHDVLNAIDELQGIEFDPGEQHRLDLTISARDERKSPVTFAHALPPEVLLAGLQAMRRHLEAS